MSHALKILIADDDADIWGAGLKRNLRDLPQVSIEVARTPEACRNAVRMAEYEIVLVDISFSSNDSSGIALARDIQESQKNAKIFMISNHDDEATMVRSLKAGALDFISKRHTDSAGLANIIRNYLADKKKRLNNASIAREIAKSLGVIAESSSMIEVFTKVAIARQNPTMPVLITGETGVGKEVVARALSLPSKSKPFVTVDCGAIPETLAESEFFGHVRGAFTGADTTKRGKFQLAHNGDLFLDEFGNLNKKTQEMLLRAIQTKEITPVGGSSPTLVNVRIIAATNENLDHLVSSGLFRQDLFERIRGIWIQIPPLRERIEDIEPLINRFIAESSKPHLTVATTCLSILKRYPWPGNVRELGNVMREMIATVDDGPITLQHLPNYFLERLTSCAKFEHECSAQPAEGITITFAPEGPLADISEYFFSQYLRERIKRLGPSASKASLARDLHITRTTVRANLMHIPPKATTISERKTTSSSYLMATAGSGARRPRFRSTATSFTILAIRWC